MNKPAFIIIGAYRCGTTSLYKYICQHPQVEKAKVKELDYFSKHWHKGKQWYFSQFKADCVTGEASPSYMADRDSVYKMLVDVPQVKIIALLRNPTDRLLSHVNHFRVKPEQALRYGHYARQLKPYLDLFENVMVINSESYYNNETTCLERIFDFLELPNADIQFSDLRSTDYSDSPHRGWLTEYYKPYNARLWELLGEQWEW